MSGLMSPVFRVVHIPCSAYSDHAMLRAVTMLVACVLVATAMTVLFIWFTRRLNKIEEERWGPKA